MIIISDLHLLCSCSFATGIIIIEILRQREGLVLVFIQILHLRQPVTVASLMVDKQNERLALIALVLHPVDTLIRHDIGHVAMFPDRCAIHPDKIRIVIVALSRKNVPIIKSSRLAHQVPFSDDCCLIAGLLQQFRHCLLTSVKNAMFIMRKSVFMAVLSCKHTGTAGSR